MVKYKKDSFIVSNIRLQDNILQHFHPNIYSILIKVSITTCFNWLYSDFLV